MFKRILKRKKKKKYVVSARETKEESITKEKVSIEQKFYWTRVGAGAVAGLFGVLVFNLIGWWMLLYLLGIMVVWPFIQSFGIFRIPYKKGEWDWKKILKTGFGAYFFVFMFVSTICFSLITLPDYRLQVNNRADTQDLYIDGDTLYIADGINGFLILDISNTSNRDLVGKYSNNSIRFTDILISNDLAFLQTESNEIFIFDIVDIEDPNLLKIYPVNANITKMKLYNNNLLYLTTDNGIFSVDYSNVSNLQINHYHSGRNYQTFEFVDENVYLINQYGELKFYNITETIPNMLNSTNLVVNNSIVDMQVIDGNLFVLSNPGNFSIYGINNITHFQYSDHFFFNETTGSMLVNNKSVMITTGEKEGIQFIDINDIDNIVSSTLDLYNTLGECVNLELYGNSVIVAEGNKGLLFINLLDPAPEPEDDDSTSTRKSISFGWNWSILALFVILGAYKKASKKIKKQ